MVHTILQLLITAVLCRYLPKMSLVQHEPNEPHEFFCVTRNVRGCPKKQTIILEFKRDARICCPPCGTRVPLTVIAMKTSLLRNGYLASWAKATHNLVEPAWVSGRKLIDQWWDLHSCWVFNGFHPRQCFHTRG